MLSPIRTPGRLGGRLSRYSPVTGGQIEFAVKPINASGRMKLKGFAIVTLDPVFAAQFGLPPVIPYTVLGSKLPNSTLSSGSTPTPTPTPTP